MRNKDRAESALPAATPTVTGKLPDRKVAPDSYAQFSLPRLGYTRPQEVVSSFVEYILMLSISFFRKNALLILIKAVFL
jgi:hypothetical protein